MRNALIRSGFVLVLAFVWAAPLAAQEAPAQDRQSKPPAAAPQAAPEAETPKDAAVPPADDVAERAVRAARSGDRSAMDEVLGKSVAIQAKPGDVVRDTKSYRDMIATTRIGEQGDVNVIVRIPNSLNMREVPPEFYAQGTISDFEPWRREGDLIQWYPVITVSIFR